MKKKLKNSCNSRTKKHYNGMKSNIGGSPQSRKSHRVRGKHPLSTIEIGSSTQTTPVTDNELRNSVKKIENNIPQIVSLPVPPTRHAFFVHVQHDKIMISDWGGKDNVYRGCIKINKKKNPDYDSNWKQYSEFMKLLEQEFNLPIEYYPIDTVLDEEAILHHKSHKNAREPDGSGGCSYYIYKWAETHQIYIKVILT